MVVKIVWQHTLQCDEPGCAETFVGPWWTAPQAAPGGNLEVTRQRARDAGWLRVTRSVNYSSRLVDLCPTHGDAALLAAKEKRERQQEERERRDYERLRRKFAGQSDHETEKPPQ